jgi:tetratricopeptide (TPR) repeat protein
MIGEIKSETNAGLAQLADNPLKETVAGMANAAVDSIRLQWGWVVLLLGALLLIAAGLLKPGIRTDSITEAIKMLDPSVLKKLPFTRKKPPTEQSKTLPEPAFTASIQSEDVCEICTEGRKHLVSGNLEQSLSAFSKAIDRDPTNRSAYFHRGLVYQKLGQKRLARSDFQSAAELGHRTAQGMVASKKFFS